jgi:hypothetical protein
VDTGPRPVAACGAGAVDWGSGEAGVLATSLYERVEDDSPPDPAQRSSLPGRRSRSPEDAEAAMAGRHAELEGRRRGARRWASGWLG